jgi:protein-tyrosine phosphatase
VSLYWIKSIDSFRLAIAARPRGGDWLGDDLSRLKASGVDILVSMLTPPEMEELGLIQEHEECRTCVMEYLNFPIDDRTVPKIVQVFNLFVDQVAGQLKSGKAVAVHCRAGIGRSSLLTACVLIRLGLTPAAAWDLIQSARGCPVPDTPEQKSFVERIAAR